MTLATRGGLIGLAGCLAVATAGTLSPGLRGSAALVDASGALPAGPPDSARIASARTSFGPGAGASRAAAAVRGADVSGMSVHPVAGAVDYGEAGARFGALRSGHEHKGQDVFAPAGTPLVAVTSGRVIESGNGGGRGHYLAIYSPKTRRTYVYLHMLAPSTARVRQRVRAGQVVGRLGCSGSCSGDHLHFEVRRGRGTSRPAIDPLPLLLRLRGQTGQRPAGQLAFFIDRGRRRRR